MSEEEEVESISGDGFQPPPPSRETEDERFLQSAVRELERSPAVTVGRDAWRVFKIMGEFVDGFQTLQELGCPAVSIFGSARTAPHDPMYKQCVTTARLLGDAGFGIITGGGPGIMEAANRGAREAGVASVGCNIELPFEQGSNRYVDTSIDFRYFFVRKTMFIKYAEGFVNFPGGFGTLDELFEALTLIQTGKVRNFPVVLFGKDYWKGMVDWLRERVADERKISPEDLDLFCVTDSPEEVVEHVATRYQAYVAAEEHRARASRSEDGSSRGE